MADYIFEYCYQGGSFTEAKVLDSFAAAVKFSADQFALLQDEGSVDPEMGSFIEVKIIHCNTGYVIATLNKPQLYAVKFSTQFSTEKMDNNFTAVNIDLIIGGTNFIEQARVLLGLLADISLQQFNLPDDQFPVPCTYLNVQDAKRDLQYLTEFCKIAQFQLSGDGSRTW